MFDEKWATEKLDMDKRHRQLVAYLQNYFPEVSSIDSGCVLDVGCGPGDFLHLCKQYGHKVVGVDAPDGEGGMGDPYLELCRKYREQFGVDVYECGLADFIVDDSVCPIKKGECVLVNSRGSIEQALSHAMIGPPHHEHHRADMLDWDLSQAEGWIDLFVKFASDLLRVGGKLLVHANGTKSTNAFYRKTICQSAREHGLKLEMDGGLLLHKWVKI